MRYFLILLIISIHAADATSNKKIEELESRIYDLELSLLQKNSLQLSGNFRTIFQLLEIEETNATLKQDTKNVTTSEVVFNINKVDDRDLKFYSSFGARYFWNDSFQSTTNFPNDYAELEVRGSFPYIYRAYFDYFLSQRNFAISAGRLPTMDGPPLEKTLGRSRMGTYPLLLYSVPLDGIALTAKLNKLLKSDKRLVLRLIYSPFYTTNSRSRITTVGVENSGDAVETKRGDVVFANLETSGKLQNLFDYSLMLQGYNIRLGRARSTTEVRGVLSTLCKAGQSAGVICAAAAGPDRNIYEIGSMDPYLGDLRSAVIHLSLDNILRSKFDLYGTLKKSFFNKRGSIKATIVEQNNGGAAPAGTVVDLGGYIYSDDEKGTEMLFGTRYNLSKQFSLGYEYVRRTFGSIPGTLKTSGITDFYQLIGHGHHAYFTKNLFNKVNITGGIMNMDKESTFTQSVYTSYPIKITSGYLNFNLNF